MSSLPMHLAPLLSPRGIGATETPEVRALPWQIDRKPTAAEAKKAATEERLSQANMLLGVAGGAVGLVLGLKALSELLKSFKKK